MLMIITLLFLLCKNNVIEIDIGKESVLANEKPIYNSTEQYLQSRSLRIS